MTIKSLLFLLFLYVALVWVGAAYWRQDDFREFGLFWTGVGLVALFVCIVGSRIWTLWVEWQTKRASRPSKPAKARPVLNEEDAALMALIAEANSALRNSPAFAGQKAPLSTLPLYLLVGPEGSGKTSTFVNSGLDPQLLAGQVAGTAPLMPTRLCNIWFARNAIFVEIGGRAFSEDLERWKQLLAVLRGQSETTFGRRLLDDPEPGWALRGVLAFVEVKEFTGSANAQRLERAAREWNQRLRAIRSVFESSFPVYTIVTKADLITFFPDYFRRLPESEASQIFGCTLPLRGEANEASAEAKRLARSFTPLYQSLANLRPAHLTHEPDPAKHPAVYEFPREFKRIRSAFVQFLADVFRPDPLQPGLMLRGYYFTAVREVETAGPDPNASRTDWSAATGPSDASRLFRGDATKFFRPDDLNVSRAAGARNGFSELRWMFASDLLQNVVLADQLALTRPPPVDRRLQLYRKGAMALVCGLCGMLCFAFAWSWLENRGLLHDVALAANAAGSGQSRQGQLERLEALRQQVERLTDHQRNGAPWRLRWGLYTGNKVVEDARRTYFRRFQNLLLNDWNGTMVAHLRGLPANPATGDPYEPVHRLLKTHLTLSAGSCKPEPPFLAGVLKEVRDAGPANADLSRELVDRQIEFYTSELPYGNPAPLTLDSEARDRAQQYLRNSKGIDRIYNAILAKAEKTVPQTQQLGELAPDYSQVLKGPGSVSAAFSREGWAYLDKASKEDDNADSGEACVVGSGTESSGGRKQDAEVELAIKRLFVRDYIAKWRSFVGGFSVLRYGNAEDAARKLDLLAGHRSPVLAVFALTAQNTSFPSAPVEPEVLDRFKPALKKILPALGKAEKAVAKIPRSQPAAGAPSTPAAISSAFQPVHWVVPPNSEKWVTESNTAYVDALAQLRSSMQEIARTEGKPDPAVHQAARQSLDKAMETVRQIARGFQPVGAAGLDLAVKRLLEQPIALAQPFIIADMSKAERERLNSELRAFCGRLRPALRKYPFHSSVEDMSVEELVGWFAPNSGEIWKFQAKSLANLTATDGTKWTAKDPAAKPQVAPELLLFLNRAQAIANAFFPGGVNPPHLTYTLRPKLDGIHKDSILELEIDGKSHQWNTSLQHQFSWPAPPGSKEIGARAIIRIGPAQVPFASRGGAWGIFRIMGDAEPRPLDSKIVEWKKLRGGEGGRVETIAPVRLEIVEFPGGADLFNPKFLEGFQCPTTAVE